MLPQALPQAVPEASPKAPTFVALNVLVWSAARRAVVEGGREVLPQAVPEASPKALPKTVPEAPSLVALTVLVWSAARRVVVEGGRGVLPQAVPEASPKAAAEAPSLVPLTVIVWSAARRAVIEVGPGAFPGALPGTQEVRAQSGLSLAVVEKRRQEKLEALPEAPPEARTAHRRIGAPPSPAARIAPRVVKAHTAGAPDASRPHRPHQSRLGVVAESLACSACSA